MKFLTGDETGICKVVHVEAQKVVRFGQQRHGHAVERLCWAGPSSKREARVAVAYEDGMLECRDGSNGSILSNVQVPEAVKCLETLNDDLLTVSASGAGSIISEWCGEACPSASSTAAVQENAGPVVRKFALPGVISDAKLEPERRDRLVFGGGDNDVKLWDLERGEVCWRAKNVREDFLCLKVAVDVSSLQWATQLAPSRSLVLCGTRDGKVRLYDCSAQRKPLFELVIGHKFSGSQGSAGYTGTADDIPRPVTCSRLSQVRGCAWSLFVGNTMGVLREYDLRHLPTCVPAAVPPGRKSHLKLADRCMPAKRGYGGIMGSIRAIDVHRNGDALVAVGLGRFAYIYDTRKRTMASKVYLKQKLCSVLMSSEANAHVKEDDGEGEEESDKDEDEVIDDEGEDELQEGFSDDDNDEDDEHGDEDDDDDDDEDAAKAPITAHDEECEAEPTSTRTSNAKKRPRKKRLASPAENVTDASDPIRSAGSQQKKKVKRK